MSNFKVGDEIIVNNYDSSGYKENLNGLSGVIEKVGLDETYWVRIGLHSLPFAWLTDSEMMLISKDNQFNIGNQIIITNQNSSYYNLIGTIEDIKYQLDDCSYRYYVRFSEKDDCSFFFTVNEISIFNLSSLFVQVTTDILS